MIPGVLSKRLAAATDSIAAQSQQLADHTEQTFVPSETYNDLLQNLGAPLDLRVLALAELTAEALRLIVNVLAEPDDGED